MAIAAYVRENQDQNESNDLLLTDYKNEPGLTLCEQPPWSCNLFYGLSLLVGLIVGDDRESQD